MTALSNLPLPPGDDGLPFIGETLSFFGDPAFAQKKHQKYGDLFRTRLLGQPTVFVRGIEANRYVLINENRHFVVSWPPSTKALLGDLSLALQTGDIHQNRRKLLAQAFMPRALAGYVETIEQITQQYLDRWAQQSELVWYPELRHYTFDIACKLLAGLNHGSQTPLGKLFEAWSAGLFSIPVALPWTRFGRAKRSREQLARELEAIIRQRQQSAALDNDTLGLLLQARDENGQGLSIAELKDQILLLLFAGHETLTSAVASFCLLVAQHPDVMTKLRAEQQQFSALEPLTLDQLKPMTYLDQVLREVMRHTPPVGGGFRKVLESCEINGYRIPKGWTLLYQIGSTHQDEQLYPDPDRFDPERFSSEQMQQQSSDRQKYGYLPFGGGLRECLGKEFARLEMKTFAVHLIRGYTWELLPDQDLTLVTIPTPHPKDGLKVRFKKMI
ncbi:MAG: cytochrome P450 [Leptolyngbya sp. IPPAS B-1204]|nr:MAG: cytochrome P450 [Leptolyngbya sp. IPPAS B-1204]